MITGILPYIFITIIYLVGVGITMGLYTRIKYKKPFGYIPSDDQMATFLIGATWPVTLLAVIPLVLTTRNIGQPRKLRKEQREEAIRKLEKELKLDET